MKRLITALLIATFIFSVPFASHASAKGVKTIRVQSTAYCEKGITATGFNFNKNPGAKVIAVDPRVIPMFSLVVIPGYGKAIARDTGGRIKGKIIDVHFKTKHQALQWGRRSVKINVYTF
ncbi:3D domain-containing protein [Sporolactobacillus spathodeae]|uniref:3D (Asp-Asp-Asp) domain-containing protein n=1 Tax=Sporolactobacillus spathodeae TaxID=1465502 RepID=A0ABS2QA41_9BACL|nr:3D domain-containing protein [Sporolactobacillus spathodeae]MBM7658657.1 3D (Asp-Asp-Asp) domain-containing protein [Sporolactobacillus spathodeae]